MIGIVMRAAQGYHVVLVDGDAVGPLGRAMQVVAARLAESVRWWRLG